LKLYPFVRLLSDTELKENEYIVKFRAGKAGHHFMKIDDNGNATDKHECNLPGKFQGWGNLEHDLEAVFAVMKQEYRSDDIKYLPQCNKCIFLNQDAYYVIEEDGYKDIRMREATKPLTFNDILREAYKKQKSSFIYNNKTFYLKINNNDSEIIYICNESQILGQFYTDGDDFIIELDDEKKNNIFGFQPSKPIQIRTEHEKDEFDYR
jgi:hypothetical protein